MAHATSVRFPEQIEVMLNDYVKAHGISKSEFIQRTIAEKLEDEYDIIQADLAYKNWVENRKKTYSHEEMMKRYG